MTLRRSEQQATLRATFCSTIQKTGNDAMSPRLHDFFPSSEMRPSQKKALDVIEEAVAAGKKYICVEAPTGVGKSHIALAVARWATTLPIESLETQSGAYLLSTQKSLTQQYISDFGSGQKFDCGLTEMRGRANYDCELSMVDAQIDCEMGPGIGCEEGKVDGCCPYKLAKKNFLGSRIGVTNFSYFLAETAHIGQLPKRTFLIIDECFPGDTLIEMASGTPKPISKVQVGDMVKCFFQDRIVARPVTAAWSRGIQPLVRIDTPSGTIRCTAKHRFLTARGWISAQQLKRGDALLGQHNGYHLRQPTSDQIQLIIGSYLGDGGLGKTANGFRIRLNHGIRQKAYCAWKMGVLGGKLRQYRSGGFAKGNPMIAGSSPAFKLPLSHMSLSPKRTIPQWMLKAITSKALAIWFMDDGSGSIGASGLNGATLHTESFTQDTCNRLRQMLLSKFGIRSFLQHTKRKYWVIRLRKADACKLRDLIAKDIHPTMTYKLGLSAKQAIPQWDGEEPLYSVRVLQVRPLMANGSKVRLKAECFDLEVQDAQNFMVRMFDRNAHTSKTKKSVIVHNCHNAEKQILDFWSIELSPQRVSDITSFHAPRLRNPNEQGEVRVWLKNTFLPMALERAASIAQKARLMMASGNKTDAAKLYKRANALSNLCDKLSAFSDGDPKDWFVYEDKGTLTFKRFSAAEIANKMLLRKGEYVLFMSATIPAIPTFLRNLGIKAEDTAILQLDSDFPKENRPVYAWSAGDMRQACIDKTLPVMCKRIEDILTRCAGMKGIIHAHSYKVTEAIASHLQRTKHAARLIFHGRGKGERERALEQHRTTTLDSVLISPSMQEGLDLKDDLSRFQVLAKVPYMALDAYTVARKTVDSQWYQAQTALTLIQASGRSVRTETDFAVTFILDGGFAYFYKQNYYLLSPWWAKSVRFIKTEEVEEIFRTLKERVNSR